MKLPWEQRKVVLNAKQTSEARKPAKKLDLHNKKLPTEDIARQQRCSRKEKKQLNTQLLDAVCDGRIRDVRRLLGAGANVNIRNTKEEGKTALMLAADKGYTNICRLLIEHGAYVNATDIERMTALMEAAFSGHTDTCALLLKKGAKLKARDNLNMTALDWAEQFDQAGNGRKTAEILKHAESLEKGD